MRGEGGDFEALALALWALQVRENIDYQAFCRDLPAPERWWQIPAVPVTLFRDLPLTKGDPEAAAVTFRTSGTTGPRGVVRLRDTALYDLGARLQARAVAGPIPDWGSSLVPHAPDSSLGHMCLDLSPGLRPRFDLVDGVDVDGVLADLDEATRDGRPLFLPGTAFAFAALLGALGPEAPPFALPQGSVLMITGGFKGRVVQLGAEELRARLDALFPGCRRVEEYGMSELSSQLWAPELRAPFSPPPWLGVQPVDPWTGAPAEVGLLRFVDLASLHTVVAIETRDLGRRLPDGRIELLGRLPGEHPRGCSLSVEEALGRAAASALASRWPGPCSPRRHQPKQRQARHSRWSMCRPRPRRPAPTSSRPKAAAPACTCTTPGPATASPSRPCGSGPAFAWGTATRPTPTAESPRRRPCRAPTPPGWPRCSPAWPACGAKIPAP